MVERMTLNHVVAGSIPAVGVQLSVDSSMVRIRAFQARGPGSIPGRRNNYFCCFSAATQEMRGTSSIGRALR